ncbi:MAG: hypothetical protein KAY37_07520, partial [Phycisphaerae bacterium]|nr:hypothetical protein [Phycisphaerae bacterium]
MLGVTDSPAEEALLIEQWHTALTPPRGRADAAVQSATRPTPCRDEGSERVRHFDEGGTSMKRAIVKLVCGCVVAGFLAPATAWGQDGHGSIVAWGYNYDGQCDVPTPNTDFVALAGGGDHSLGLKSDGSIVAWGSNGSGQCDVPA